MKESNISNYKYVMETIEPGRKLETVGKFTCLSATDQKIAETAQKSA